MEIYNGKVLGIRLTQKKVLGIHLTKIKKLGEA